MLNSPVQDKDRELIEDRKTSTRKVKKYNHVTHGLSLRRLFKEERIGRDNSDCILNSPAKEPCIADADLKRLFQEKESGDQYTPDFSEHENEVQLSRECPSPKEYARQDPFTEEWERPKQTMVIDGNPAEPDRPAVRPEEDNDQVVFLQLSLNSMPFDLGGSLNSVN